MDDLERDGRIAGEDDALAAVQGLIDFDALGLEFFRSERVCADGHAEGAAHGLHSADVVRVVM
ncbi:MAG: hypothetical protein R2724_10485 [Bryobacterales bacterium]